MSRIVAACLVLVAAAALVGDYTTDSIKFATASPNGLVWPLPDSNDLVSILIHGVHCKHMVAMNHNGTNMGRMHVAHCGRVKRMIEELPAPDISLSLCKTIFGLSSAYYQFRARMGGYGYYSDDELHVVNRGEALSNPTEALVRLAGYNYGSLLMKEWDTPSKLSDVEREYLNSWFSPVHLTQARIAYRCQELGVEVYELKDEPGTGAYETTTKH